MTQEDKIKAILEMCNNCIILVPNFRFDKRNNRFQDAFTVIEESCKCLGHKGKAIKVGIMYTLKH